MSGYECPNCGWRDEPAARKVDAFDDLLAACEAALPHLECEVVDGCDCGICEATHLVRAAIAKAREA